MNISDEEIDAVRMHKIIEKMTNELPEELKVANIFLYVDSFFTYPSDNSLSPFKNIYSRLIESDFEKNFDKTSESGKGKKIDKVRKSIEAFEFGKEFDNEMLKDSTGLDKKEVNQTLIYMSKNGEIIRTKRGKYVKSDNNQEL